MNYLFCVDSKEANKSVVVKCDSIVKIEWIKFSKDSCIYLKNGDCLTVQNYYEMETDEKDELLFMYLWDEIHVYKYDELKIFSHSSARWCYISGDTWTRKEWKNNEFVRNDGCRYFESVKTFDNILEYYFDGEQLENYKEKYSYFKAKYKL